MGKGNNPKNLLPNYCPARPPKAKRQNKFWKTFIKNNKVLVLFRWLKWWHDRINVQGYEDSISNQVGAIQQVGFERQVLLFHTFNLVVVLFFLF